MSEYHDAAHEAYERLMWAQENRPPHEEVEKVRKALAQEERQRKISRLRKSVA